MCHWAASPQLGLTKRPISAFKVPVAAGLLALLATGLTRIRSPDFTGFVIQDGDLVPWRK